MGNTMIIQSSLFNLLFYLIVLGIGIDFTISGILLMRDYDKYLRKTKLLGLIILRLNQSFFDRMRKHNQIYGFVYSSRSIKFFTLAAGILITVGSLIQIITILD
jgi:hypothetical protein